LTGSDRSRYAHQAGALCRSAKGDEKCKHSLEVRDSFFASKVEERSMKFSRLLFIVAAAASPLAAQVAPRVATTLPAGELSALMAIRKAVWVDWFGGDTTALKHVLGPELIAISPDSPNWQSLSESLAASAQFKAGGGKLVSVTFDSDVIHRFGDVVVMFSRYSLVMENGGQQATQKGRATEVFVRSNGKWVHTSWHLDATA
jgi:hypothetical protein